MTTSARADGWETLWGACREHAGAPAYWPWVNALRGTALEGFEASLTATAGDSARLVIQLFTGAAATANDSTQLSAVAHEQARFMLFDRLSSFLAEAARTRPLLIMLDDLHWADQPSLQLLEFVASELETAPLLIVGTFRDEEVSRNHPLSETLGLLAPQPRVDRMRLPELSATAVGELLAHATGEVPSTEVVAAVHERTAGNPFFAREVGQLLRDTGALVDGLASDSLPATIPDTVRGAIGRRLSRLSDECVELLSVAAVLGAEYDLLTLQTVGRTKDGLEEALSEAFTAGILVETSGFTRGIASLTR